MLALGLHQRLRSRGILRIVFFLPFILPSLIVGVLWQFLYSPDGPIDSVLESVGLGFLAPLWLGDSSIALWSVIVALIWQNVGFSLVRSEERRVGKGCVSRCRSRGSPSN